MTLTDMPDATLAERLEALRHQRTQQARRDQWRRAAGTDGNNHSQKWTPEVPQP